MQSFLGPLLGAFIGVFGGFLFNRYLLNNSRKKRRRSVLKAVKACLRHNEDIVNDLTLKMSDPTRFPVTYPMDTVALEATASLRCDVMDNGDTDNNTDLNIILSLLENLNFKFDLLWRRGETADFYNTLRSTILHDLLPQLRSLLRKEISWIEGELAKAK